jgi:RNA polymerase sigma factor (sigma-70 family)
MDACRAGAAVADAATADTPTTAATARTTNLCFTRSPLDGMTRFRLWSHRERFDAGRGSLRSFALADVHGRCVDAIRSEEARRRREEHDAGVVPAARPEDPEEQATSQIFADHIRRALTALPPEQRDAIELGYLDGRSYREAAQILGEPEGTVKSRIRVGLGRLRGVMEESGATTA